MSMDWGVSTTRMTRETPFLAHASSSGRRAGQGQATPGPVRRFSVWALARPKLGRAKTNQPQARSCTENRATKPYCSGTPYNKSHPHHLILCGRPWTYSLSFILQGEAKVVPY